MCAATVQSIFSSLRLYKKIDPSKLNRKQRHVLADICSCRTKERGFHLDRCENCGDEILHYNSCQNPCCPKCQAVAKEIWSMKQEFYTLNIPYFHVVFTLPSELNQLALVDPVLIYNLLFECAAESLKTLAADPKYLGASIVLPLSFIPGVRIFLFILIYIVLFQAAVLIRTASGNPQRRSFSSL